MRQGESHVHGYLCEVYLRQTPPLLKALASQLIWNGPAHVQGENAVYLTFDDGPHPEITREVMGVLAEFSSLATFFCVGDNVASYPEVLDELRGAGHGIGNHTQRHDSGWGTGQMAYLRSYLECQQLVQSPWFRPPYGRITKAQAAALHPHTQIVMWDVLSADFDVKNTPSSCLEQLMINTRPGSIVVFHDSPRASARMLPILRPYLTWLQEEGYRCRLLPRNMHESSR
ncbi:MAG: polysaccharide deacetylase family protein [Flavobacteriales bacterium]|nr:polysaccharide deacetylase family protein [Flavobacteriales bacterium]